MKKILNLTRHKASAEQIEHDVFDMDWKERKILVAFLSLRISPEDSDLILNTAENIAVLALEQKKEAQKAMIGGDVYDDSLMIPLERALRAQGITPVYSVRDIYDSSKKHIGFVEKTRDEE